MKRENRGVATRTASRATKVGGWIGKPWCGAAVVFLFLAAPGVAAQQPGDSVRVSGELVGVAIETDIWVPVPIPGGISIRLAVGVANMGIIDSTRQRRFSDEKMRKVNLFETGQMFCDVYCLRPGQAQHVHTHADATKFYYVIEGRDGLRWGNGA